MRTLYGLRQSPWTERARWALDHHAVSYRYHEHVPGLGEVLLRKKAGSLRENRASVPLLVDGRDVLKTGAEIARHADRIGRGAPLFPRSSERDLMHYVELSDRISGVGRAYILPRLMRDRAAQRESLPSFLPGPAKRMLSPVAATAAWFLSSKYAVPRDVEQEIEKTLRPALEEVRRSLAGKSYLLGSFSFADVAIASSLRALRPEERAPIGPATRAMWTNEPVANAFEDLLMWRDALYAKHR
ncbi:Glutathione S-transferase family protein [Labilithrix luteola]|uniref:Glutathione S-transferase family protein n=1 Tax=Labilithrix luteola TaxID=1391654 RepID=A0A0K1QEH4_9BACT|nr:glutathione S-transferase N-terminal domain-containing protein [Labilithrix luteola]AKV04166.1 Glutathione S-transferase family protein [Labilithrix luteola]